jgi:hypothetical protein
MSKMMDLLNPLAVRVMGAHINRCTFENVRRAGFQIDRLVNDGPAGMIKLVVARSKDKLAEQRRSEGGPS